MSEHTHTAIGGSTAAIGALGWLHDGITSLTIMDLFGISAMVMGMVASYYSIKANRKKIEDDKESRG